MKEGENYMKENDTPCCEDSGGATSRSCCPSNECGCGKPVGRKSLKMIICLVIALAAVCIMAYRLSQASQNAGGGRCCEPNSSCCPGN